MPLPALRRFFPCLLALYVAGVAGRSKSPAPQDMPSRGTRRISLFLQRIYTKPRRSWQHPKERMLRCFDDDESIHALMKRAG